MSKRISNCLGTYGQTEYYVDLEKDGGIYVGCDDRSYHGGAYGYSLDGQRGGELIDIADLIDLVAQDNPKIYADIRNHIKNGSYYNDRIEYRKIASYCDWMISFINDGEKLSKEEFNERREEFFGKISLRKVKDYSFVMEYFEDTLSIKGLSKKSTQIWESIYYYNKDGEVFEVQRPSYPSDRKGSIEPVKLPIIDEEAICKFVEENSWKRIRQGWGDKNVVVLDERKVLENYHKRCNQLKEKLSAIGAYRDIKRHAFYDKDGKEIIVRKPDLYDENDLGSWEYAVQTHDANSRIGDSGEGR